MKKKLAAFLSAAMLITVLAACNNNGTDGTTTVQETDGNGQTTEAPDDTEEPDDTDEPDDTEDPNGGSDAYDMGGRTIRLSAWWDLTPIPGESEQTDQLIERYEQLEADYNITFEYVNVPWEDYQRTYITQSMGGDSIADLAIVEYNWLYPNLATNGFVADVSQLENFNFDDEKWNQDVRTLTTFDGETYGFETGRPFPVGVLFWNKSMFAREGVDEIYDTFFDGEWTWDGMLEIAQTLTRDTDGDGITDQWGLSGTNLIHQFVHSNGGQVIDISNPNAPAFSLLSDNALEGFQAMQDFAQTHQVVELNPEGAEWDYARTQFVNGNVGMFAGQWWMVDSMRDGMEDDYGVVLFPMGPQMDTYTSHNTALNVTTIPETVEDKEDIALIYNLRTEPLPDEDPDDWRIYYEDRVTDSDSVSVIEMLQDEGLSVLDVTSSFAGVVELSYGYNDAIQTGAETPQAAISAIADQAQNLIDTAMRRSPDEIVDELTPDEDEGEDDNGDEDDGDELTEEDGEE